MQKGVQGFVLMVNGVLSFEKTTRKNPDVPLCQLIDNVPMSNGWVG